MSTASATAVTGYDSRRLGTGLVQARRAAAAKTYASTPTGLDSLAFGMNQLGGAYREKRTFQLTNRSTTSVRYGLRATFSSPVRGAALTFSPSALTLKAGRTATVTATLALSAAEVAALPGASASDRGSLSTLHGVVVATPRTATAAHPVLRTAFLSVPVPLSAVTAPASATAGATGDPAPVRLTNAGPHAGTATVYQALLSDPAGDASGTETADVTDLGVRAEPAPSGDPADRLLVLAVGEARGTSTHGTRTALVALDVDGDGAADFRVFSRDTGYQDRGVPDGTLTSFTVDAENHVVDRWTSSAPANGSTVLLPVLASSLGVTAASPPLGVQLAGFSELGARGRRDRGGALPAVPPGAGPGTGGDGAGRRHRDRALSAGPDPARAARPPPAGWSSPPTTPPDWRPTGCGCSGPLAAPPSSSAAAADARCPGAPGVRALRPRRPAPRCAASW